MNSRNISKKAQTNDFNNLKSNFILRKIFDVIKEIESLSIMRYNKKLQKKIKYKY